MKLMTRLASLFTLVATAACGPSLSAMHTLAERGEVQPDAPLHAHTSIVIAAPRARVYAVLSDFASWHRWQPDVAMISPPPQLAPGARFTWRNGKATIQSQLAAVRPGELLAWTGKVSTAKAIHVWRLSSPTPETTRVEVEETLDGFLLTWFYGQADLDREVARSLARLDAASTDRARWP